MFYQKLDILLETTTVFTASILSNTYIISIINPMKHWQQLRVVMYQYIFTHLLINFVPAIRIRPCWNSRKKKCPMLLVLPARYWITTFFQVGWNRRSHIIDGGILVFEKKKKKKKMVYSRSYGPIAAADHNLDRLSENLSRALTTLCTFMQQQTEGDVLKHEPQTCRVKHPLRLFHP